jgi:hypothetical protein
MILDQDRWWALQLMAKAARSDLEGFRYLFHFFGDIGVDLRPVFDLVDFARERGFFTSPASTRFHGVYEGGLAEHSLGVLGKTFALMDSFGFGGDVDSGWLLGLVVGALFHDLCKADLYEVSFRNVKNANGVWNKEPFYRVRDGSTGVGHGTESLRRISKFMGLPYEWELAVAWHMGSYGLTSEDNIQYMNCCRMHCEVLLLHTADMLQVSSGGA